MDRVTGYGASVSTVSIVSRVSFVPFVPFVARAGARPETSATFKTKATKGTKAAEGDESRAQRPNRTLPRMARPEQHRGFGTTARASINVPPTFAARVSISRDPRNNPVVVGGICGL